MALPAPLRIASVCTGYGGLELGIGLAHPAHAVVVVEREAYAAANLAALMEVGRLRPAPIWDDVTTFDGRAWAGAVDLLAGGIPCVGYSVAGLRKHADDERDLVDHFVRIAGECCPALAFVENVPDFVRLGGARRLGEGLQRLGFCLETPRIVAAEDVGAPHKRERVFLLAWHVSDSGRDVVRQLAKRDQRDQRAPERRHPEPRHMGEEVADGGSVGFTPLREAHSDHRDHESWDVADGCCAGMADAGGVGLQGGCVSRAEARAVARRPLWPPGPGTDALIEAVRDGAPEPGIRGLAHGHPDWLDELRLCGNGVVPLAVGTAFRMLVREAAERLDLAGKDARRAAGGRR